MHGAALSAHEPEWSQMHPENLPLEYLQLEHRELLESNAELEHSRERYAHLYDFAPVGYLTLNHAGCIAKINLAGAWLLKRSRGQLVRMPFLFFVSKPDRRKFLHHLSLCRERRGEQVSTELWLRPVNGEPATCLELISRVPVEARSSFFNSILIDVTRRKEAEEQLRATRDLLEQSVRERTRELTLTNQALEGKIAEHHRAEQALRESEERWRLMIEGARDYAIYMLDTRGHVVTWNSAAQQVQGYRASEILGRHISSFYTVEDARSGIPEKVLKTAIEQGRAEREGWSVRKNRTRFWANVVTTALRDPGGRLRGFLKITRDITERMQAQTILRESEEKLSDFFERSPIGLVWTGPDGRIQRINQACADLVGKPRMDCLNRRLSEFLPDPNTAGHLMNQIRQRAIVREFRARIRRGAQRTGTVLVDADGLWERGRLIQGRFFIRDISGRVELEREILLVAEREQRRIGRDLHDDLCQQLTGIEFLSQTLATELGNHYPAGAEQAREIAGLVRQSIASTRELARGLSPMQLETMGLPGALQELSRRSHKLFGIDCSFNCQTPFKNHRDDSVSVHLYRIAQEAVANAVKHGKARQVEIDLKCERDRLMLAVRDDGVGMPDPIPKRHGMGLHIMQYRADVIGGTVSVESRPGGGTSILCTVRELNGKANNLKPHESNQTFSNRQHEAAHLHC